MYPPVYPLLVVDSVVAAYLGTRIYPHGRAPQRVIAPYLTYDVLGGAPENTLDGTPLVDSYVTRVRVWSDQDAGATDVYALGEAVRDCLEAAAHMEGVPMTGRDEETLRHYIELQFRFWVDRPPNLTSAPENTATLWRPVYPIVTDGIFDGAYLPNPAALWRVVSVDSPNRWAFYGGGGYIFSAIGAELGEYVLTYEIRDWDGNGNDQTATVTVIVE
jgi:hypothetical protein